MNKIEKNLVSIIIPVFNTAKYLDYCFQSILKQTYKEIEVIIVDDGSTDNSLDIIKKYVSLNENFKYFIQKNSGQGVARNNGLKKAKGEFIQFVDSDDIIENNMIEKMINSLKKDSSDFSNCLLGFDDGEKKRSYKKRFDYKVLEGNHIIKDYMKNKNIYTSPVNKLFRHIFLKENKIIFPEIKGYEDSYFILLASYYSEKVSFVEEVLYYAFERRSSTSRNFTIEKFKSLLLSLKMEREFLKQKKILKKYIFEYTYRSLKLIYHQIKIFLKKI